MEWKGLCVGDKTENRTDVRITYVTNTGENQFSFIIFNAFSVSSSSSSGGGLGGTREYR
jgi:hypothetical protein